MNQINRRTFVTGAAGAAVWAMSARRSAAAPSANDTVVLALMGANNRGAQLAHGFGGLTGATIAYVCDPDERAIQKGIDAVVSRGGAAPKGVTDFRRALDDPAVDAIICAAPNHWHAAATLAACAAGKHVYVEKPLSHTAEEGELIIEAARRSGRVVQVGMQRRSGPLYQEVVEKVRGGAIGNVLFGKSWYHRDRPSIGRAKPSAPPNWLDYDLWQGPALERPYRENILHYHWHNFWHWGDGELGNNGVHTIDICRWAMDVAHPNRVTSSGSKLRYDDDQETPDTMTAVYECGDKTIVWEGISWSLPYVRKSQIGVELRGDAGTLYVDDGGYVIYDSQSKVVEKHQGSRGDAEHLQNFLDAVRTETAVNASAGEGHKSALFSHLGNIAYRTGQSLEIDPANGRILNNAEAQTFWKCEYRPGWIEKA